MNAEDAIRYLAHEAERCAGLNGRDEREMVVLLLPGLMKACDLPPMDDFEAAAFRRDFKARLNREPANGHHRPGVFAHLLE